MSGLIVNDGSGYDPYEDVMNIDDDHVKATEKLFEDSVDQDLIMMDNGDEIVSVDPGRVDYYMSKGYELCR